MTDLAAARRRTPSLKTLVILFAVFEAIVIFGALAAPYVRSHWR